MVLTTLRTITLPILGITAIFAIVAALVGGSDAAVGALTGGVLVSVFLSSSTSILESTTKANPELSLLVALSLFMGKVAVMLVLLAVFLNSDKVAEKVDSQWLGVTLLVTSLCTTVLQIRAYRRKRVLAYDLGEDN